MLVILKFLFIQFASSHNDHLNSKCIDIIEFSSISNTPQILSHYQCIHTQIAIANDGTICYVECGFLGHQSDAQQFMLMRQIGIDLPLFPDDLYLLGDKIYPNRHPIMTPYTRQQIARKPLNLQQKCRKMKTYHRIPC